MVAPASQAWRNRTQAASRCPNPVERRHNIRKPVDHRERARTLKLGAYPALTLDDARTAARAHAGQVAKGQDPAQEREEIRRLRKENFELRRANEILKSASVYFAKELDPDRPK